MCVEIAECQAPQVVDKLLPVRSTRLHREPMLERQRGLIRPTAFPFGRQREDNLALDAVEWPLKTEHAITLEPRELLSRIRTGRRTVGVPPPEGERAVEAQINRYRFRKPLTEFHRGRQRQKDTRRRGR